MKIGIRGWKLWETFNIPTALRRTLKIHHMSRVKNASFDPDPITPCSSKESCLRPVCRWLTYSSSDEIDTSEDHAPSPHISSQIQPHKPDCQTSTSKGTLDANVYPEDSEEENFQTVPLDDAYWTTKEIPDRPLWIHKYSLPNGLCPYLCPYANYQIPSYIETMELSNISDFEDIMITSSDEDIPALEAPPYWKNSGLHWTLHIDYKLLIIIWYPLLHVCTW